MHTLDWAKAVYHDDIVLNVLSYSGSNPVMLLCPSPFRANNIVAFEKRTPACTNEKESNRLHFRIRSMITDL